MMNQVLAHNRGHQSTATQEEFTHQVRAGHGRKYAWFGSLIFCKQIFHFILTRTKENFCPWGKWNTRLCLAGSVAAWAQCLGTEIKGEQSWEQRENSNLTTVLGCDWGEILNWCKPAIVRLTRKQETDGAASPKPFDGRKLSVFVKKQFISNNKQKNGWEKYQKIKYICLTETIIQCLCKANI